VLVRLRLIVQPQSENVLRCALQPLNFADYPVTFTSAEQAQLRQASPPAYATTPNPASARSSSRTPLDYGG